MYLTSVHVDLLISFTSNIFICLKTNHSKYQWWQTDRGAGRRTDGRQTITLCFPLDKTSLIPDISSDQTFYSFVLSEQKSI